MPIYEYECTEKGHRFDVMQKISDAPIKTCQVCGGQVKKLISASAFHLKGGGWYKDGYASTGSNGSKPASEGSGSASSKSESGSAKSDAGKSETKTTKGESK